jgi:chorismate-pyruvate lyase
MPDTPSLDLAGPLADLHPDALTLMPDARSVSGDDVPAPYHDLLVHRSDMTSTLSRYHGSEIQLQVLQQSIDEFSILRAVILRRCRDNQPVEYGAIRIFLKHFPDGAAATLLSGTTPLGTVLSEFNIPYVSNPLGFIRLHTSNEIAKSLELETAGDVVYGRRNRHLTPAGDVLADILEILPPDNPARNVD